MKSEIVILPQELDIDTFIDFCKVKSREIYKVIDQLIILDYSKDDVEKRVTLGRKLYEVDFAIQGLRLQTIFRRDNDNFQGVEINLLIKTIFLEVECVINMVNKYISKCRNV